MDQEVSDNHGIHVPKATSMMSKKRYHQIEKVISDTYQDDEKLVAVMEGIRMIMNFDPEVSRYTPEISKKIKEYRHRLRDEKGISTYITNGGKKRYETLKASKTKP